MVLPTTWNHWTRRKINNLTSKSSPLTGKERSGETSWIKRSLLKIKSRKSTTYQSFIRDKEIERSDGREIVLAQIRNDGCWSSERIGLNSKQPICGR